MNIYSVPIIVYFSNLVSETEKVNNSVLFSVSQIYTFGEKKNTRNSVFFEKNI